MKTCIILLAAAVLCAGRSFSQEASPAAKTNPADNEKAAIVLGSATVFAGGIFLFHKLMHKEEIPQAVMDAAKARFPNATEFEWEKEDDAYEAEVEMGEDNEMEAKFRADGTWLSTEQELKSSALPQIILSAIAASEYKDWKLDEEARKLETPDQKEIYIVELEKGKDERVLSIDGEGKIIKAEKDKD